MSVSVSKVASAATSTTLAAASNRIKLIIENSDTNRLYIRLDGGTASATDFSYSLAQNEKAEIINYKGRVTGIWAGDGTGFAHVTEMM
jgi:hypothetical protein